MSSLRFSRLSNRKVDARRIHYLLLGPVMALAMLGGFASLMSQSSYDAEAAPAVNVVVEADTGTDARNEIDPRRRGGGRVFYVSASGTGDCSETDPCSLLSATNQAIDGDELWLAGGGLPENIYSDIVTGSVLYLNKSITVRGGYVEGRWDLDPDPDRTPTIIDPARAGRAVIVVGGSPIIENLEIQNGNAPGSGEVFGGGIYIESGTPIIRNNKIHNNSASSEGGGIFDSGGATIINNEIYANSTSGGGGGIAIRNLTPLSITTIIEFNNIYNNAAAFSGGAVRIAGPASSGSVEVLVNGNYIYSNRAERSITSSGFGGGLLSDFIVGSLTIANNFFYDNQANTSNIGDFGAGGAIAIRNGENNIWNNTIVGNRAPSASGGVEGGGGGIAIYTGTVELKNNIIANNSNQGVYAVEGSGAPLATISGSHNGFAGNAENISLFLTNTITTTPIFVNEATGDLHLTDANPDYIDAGASVALENDFDQQIRPFDGGFDIGADEVYPASFTCFARVNEEIFVHTDIQSAINETSDGDIIRVAGRCTGIGTEVIHITNTITLMGGFTTTDWVNQGGGATVIDAEDARRGILVDNANPTIDSIHVTGGNTTGNGSAILLQGSTTAIVQNTVLYGNTNDEAGDGALGVQINAFNSTLRFLTIADNVGSGIVFDGDGVVNNSIFANNNFGGAASAIVGGFGHDYNLFFNNDDTPSPSMGANSLVGDPDFVDPANGDYHIAPASTAIDVGSDMDVLAGEITSDFEGEARPLSLAPDMGADESSDFLKVNVVPSYSSVRERGTTAIYRHTIRNEGSIADTYDITLTNTFTWVTSLAPTIISLNPGEEATFEVQVEVPLDAAPRQTNLTTIRATSRASALAFDEVVDTTIARQDVSIRFTPNYSFTVEPRTSVTLVHTLKNEGDFLDTFTLDIVEDTFGWATLGSDPMVSLGVNESTFITVVVNVPRRAQAGLVNLVNVRATSAVSTSFFAIVTDTIIAEAVPGTRHVSANASAEDENNNCSDPLAPCATIKHAIGQALQGDPVRIAQGTYNEFGMNLNSSLALSGGWLGNFSEQAIDPTLTVINANRLGRHFNIFPGTFPSISNLELRNGRAVNGGSIFVSNSALPTLSRLSFVGNTAFQGGAVYIAANTNVKLNRSRFFNNRTDPLGSGGGVYFVGGTLDLFGNLFHNNQSTTNGAGVYLQAGTVSAWNNTYDGNVAVGNGAGIYNQAAILNIRNSIFSHNEATAGPGLFDSTGLASLDYNIIWQNTPNTVANVSVGTHSRTVDPQYADDWRRIKKTSPALDAADPTTTVRGILSDFEANIRPSHQFFDIGWHELGGCLVKRDENIYGGIQFALDSTTVTRTLVLVHGTCLNVNTRTDDGSTIKQGVFIDENFTLRGGYNAAFEDYFDLRFADTYEPSYIDALGRGRGVYITNTIKARIENITVQNGDASGLAGDVSGNSAGGGVYNGSGNLFLSNVDVYSGTASFGGGVYNSTGIMTFTSPIIPTLVEEAWLEAGLSNQYLQVSTNEVGYNAGGTGGGIYNAEGDLTIFTGKVFSNTAFVAGGGIANRNGALNVANTFLYNNVGGNGGAIWNAGTITTTNLQHLTFYNNRAIANGGAIFVDAGVVDVDSSIFQSNSAGNPGSAIFVNTGTANSDYNYFHNNLSPMLNGVSLGVNDIQDDINPPGLIAPNADDLRLSALGSAVDQGNPDSNILFDFQRDLRPINQGFDMGADEVAGCLAKVNDVIYGSIQQAHDAALHNDQIDVYGNCFGIHAFDTGGPLGVVSQTVHLTQTVHLLGGWNKAFTDQDPARYPTTIDALGLGRVFYIAPDITPTIEGFNIINGNARVSGLDGNGGAFYLDQTQAYIRENNIYFNEATRGGAIYFNNSSSYIESGNHIYSNTAQSFGGAIYVENTVDVPASIHNNFIYANLAQNGGAFYHNTGRAHFWNNTVISNTASFNGGNLYLTGDVVDVRNNIIQSGHLTNISGEGAGAWVDTGIMTVTIDYNNWYLNDSDDNVAGPAGIGEGANSLSVDPMYILGVDGSPYHIGLFSPMRDTGIDVDLFVDHKGTIRPSNQTWDIGADEFTSRDNPCQVINEDTPEILYGSLTYALRFAERGDTLLVQGVCYGTNENGGTRQNLYLDKEVTVDGDPDNDGLNVGILHALDEGRVVFVPTTITPTIKDIVLVSGDATVPGLDGNGGGVYNLGILTLNNVWLQNNYADNGAGIYQADGYLRAIRNNISNNFAENNGGNIYHAGGMLDVDGNRIHIGHAVNGAGIYLDADNASVHNNFIYTNTAESFGGGIYHNVGIANIIQFNTIYQNHADNEGAGIYAESGDPTIVGNIIDTNSGSGIHITTTATSTDFGFNNVVNNTGGDYSGIAPAASDISTAPSYEDATVFDLHLTLNSVGVDYIAPLSLTSIISPPIDHDIEGDLRPTNAGHDIGADELDSCLVRVTNDAPTLSVGGVFGVLQDAIDFAEASSTYNTIEIARGICSGVQERGGTWQVAYVTRDLTFNGSLRRLDFADLNDYGNVYGITSVIDAQGQGRGLVIASGATVTFDSVAFVNGNALVESGDGGNILNLSANTSTFTQVASCSATATNGAGYYGESTSDVDFKAARFGACSPASIVEDRNTGVVRSFTFVTYGGNVVDNNGAGVYVDVNATFEIRNGSLNDNHAITGNGAGLYNRGTTNLTNVVIGNNWAENGDGGGVYHAEGNLDIIHNTIYYNTANGNGGGVAVDPAASRFVLDSSIVYTNTATGTGGGVFGNGTLDYNNFYDNFPNATNGVSTGSNSISARPIFYRGPILEYNSPDVDKANPATLIDYDISNITRPDGGLVDEDGILWDGTIDGTTIQRADIGADEYDKKFDCLMSVDNVIGQPKPGESVIYELSALNIGIPYLTLAHYAHQYTDTFTTTIAGSTFPEWVGLIGGDPQVLGPLDVQTSGEFTFVVSIPLTATAGMANVSVLQCQSFATTGTVHQINIRTLVGRYPFADVEPNYTARAQPGDVLTRTFTITNTGNTTGTFVIAAKSGVDYASAVLVLPDGTQVLTHAVDLELREVVNIRLRAQVAETAIPGETARPSVVVFPVDDPEAVDEALLQILILDKPATRYVNGSLGADAANNCAVATDPCRTLPHALDIAVSGDDILLTSGVYSGFVTTTVGSGDVVTSSLYVDKSITITGGFHPSYLFQEPLTYTTYIRGTDNQHAFYIEEGHDVILNGLVIEDAVMDSTVITGGAIYNAGSNLSLYGVWLRDNQANLGAGVYHVTGTLHLNSSALLNNINIPGVSGQGAGIYAENGTLIIENGSFFTNIARNGGGAIYQVAGDLTVLNSIFDSNVGNGSVSAIQGPASVTHNNNLFFGTPTGVAYATFALDASSIIADPQFADLWLHIGQTSPARDAGTNSGVLRIETDFDGELRDQGAGIDIGADEYDLSPKFILVPTSDIRNVEPDTLVVYTFALTNTGPVTDSYFLTMTHDSTSAGWFYTTTMPTTVGPLAPGEGIMFDVEILSGLPGSMDDTVITATSAITEVLVMRTALARTLVNQLVGVDIEPDSTLEGMPGITVIHRHVVTNTGNAVDSFTLEAQSFDPAWDTTISKVNTGDLARGESTTVEVSITIPFAGTSVQTVVTATSDVNPSVSDTVLDTTILVLSSVRVGPDYNDVVMAGDVLRYIHTVTNTGTFTDDYTLVVSDTFGWVTSPMTDAFTLGAGESMMFAVDVTVPVDATPGQEDTILITVASVDLPDTNFDTATDVLRVNQNHALTFTPLEQQQFAPLNGEAIYFHTLTNTGDGRDTFLITAESNRLRAIDVGSPSVTLDPGASIDIPITLTIGSDPITDVMTVVASARFSPTVRVTATNTTIISGSVPIGSFIEFTPNREATLEPGQSITYVHTLRNTGSVTRTFNINTTPGLGWIDTAPVSSVELGAGASTDVSMVIFVPPTATASDVDVTTITAQAADDASITASVMDTTRVTVTVPAVVSITLVSDTAQNAIPGDAIIYVHTLTNRGSDTDTISLVAGSSQGWFIEPFVSPVTLASGESTTVLMQIIVPVTATAGMTDVTTIRATSGLDPLVTDSVVDTTTVVDADVVDIIISPALGRQETFPNTSVVYTHTVINAGTSTDTITITFSSAPNNWVGSVTPPASVTLAPGASTEIAIQIDVPSSATAGMEEETQINIYSTNDLSVFDFAIDTTVVLDVIGGAIRLTPDNTAMALPGDVVVYTHRLENLGTVTDLVTIGAVSDNGWISRMPPATISVASGETVTFDLEVTVPVGTPLDTTDVVTVTATSGNDPSFVRTALDTTIVTTPSNVIFLPILRVDTDGVVPTPTPTSTVPPTTPPPTPVTCDLTPPATANPAGIDLIVTNIVVQPATPASGTPATIRVTIKNQGQTDVPFGNNFYTDFYVDRVPVALLAGDIAWGVQGGDLGAGDTKTLVGQYTFSGGEHRLYAQVDTDGFVTEDNEGNNVYGCMLINASGFAEPDTTPMPQAPSSGPRSTPTPFLVPEPPVDPEPLPELPEEKQVTPIPQATSIRLEADLGSDS